MSIKKYWNGDSWIEQMNNVFDDWAQLQFFPVRTYTYRGQWVDPDKYDIVPKESYKKTLIENKQKELDQLEEDRKRLEKELKELKG